MRTFPQHAILFPLPPLLPLLLPLLLAHLVFASELIVRATDAETGKPVKVDAHAVAGGRVHVYARGYDLAQAPLRPGQSEVAVRLRPASGSCELQLEAAAELEIVYLLDAGAGPPREKLRDAYEVVRRGPRVRLVLPRGLDAQLSVRGRGALVWPATVRAEDGGRYRLHLERPRVVAVALGDPVDPATSDFFPDLLWEPGAEPGRVDAWRAHLNRPGWLREEFVARTGRLRVVPDVPFHFFGLVGSVPVYRYVAPDQESLDLRRPRPPRTVAEPRIDGAPPRPGTVLAPGKLDLHAISMVASLEGSLRGCCHVVAGGDWPAVRLPGAEWLTAWHPETGLAHLPWNDRPQGRTHPGQVTVRVPKDFRAAGTVSVYPVWRGTGAVRTTPPENGLRLRFDGDAPALFRGLPWGRYGMSVQVVLTPHHPGDKRRIGRTYEFELRARTPAPVYELPTR